MEVIMSSEVIDIPSTPTEQAPQQAQPTPQEQIQTAINNEMRFCEETLIRAVRTCVVNVVSIVQQQQAK